MTFIIYHGSLCSRLFSIMVAVVRTILASSVGSAGFVTVCEVFRFISKILTEVTLLHESAL